MIQSGLRSVDKHPSLLTFGTRVGTCQREIAVIGPFWKVEKKCQPLLARRFTPSLGLLKTLSLSWHHRPPLPSAVPATIRALHSETSQKAKTTNRANPGLLQNKRTDSTLIPIHLRLFGRFPFYYSFSSFSFIDP
jgi:hypothetical protein